MSSSAVLLPEGKPRLAWHVTTIAPASQDYRVSAWDYFGGASKLLLTGQRPDGPSHARGLVACAVIRAGPSGVDVERNAAFAMDTLPERVRLRLSDDRRRSKGVGACPIHAAMAVATGLIPS